MTGIKRIFLDTAPIIYVVEKKPLYYEKVSKLFMMNAEADYITSVITVAEFLPYPYRQENGEELIRQFDRFLEEAEITVLDINREIAEDSARIRAAYPAFKTMDSLQLAAALSCDCDLFLTNDKQLRQFTGIPCMTLDDL